MDAHGSERQNPIWGYVAVVALVLGLLAKLLVGSGFSGPTHKSGAGSTLAIVFLLMIVLFLGLAAVRKLAWSLPRVPRRVLFAVLSVAAMGLWFKAALQSQVGDRVACFVALPGDAEYAEILGTSPSPDFLHDVPWGRRFSDLGVKGEPSQQGYGAPWGEAPTADVVLYLWANEPSPHHTQLAAGHWTDTERVRYVRVSGPVEPLQAATAAWGPPSDITLSDSSGDVWLDPETRVRTRLFTSAYHPECGWAGGVLYEQYSEIDDILGMGVERPFAAIDEPLLGISVDTLRAHEGPRLWLDRYADRPGEFATLPPLARSHRRPQLRYTLDSEQRVLTWTLEINECGYSRECEPLAYEAALERFGPFEDPADRAPRGTKVSAVRPGLSIRRTYPNTFSIRVTRR